MAYKVLYRKYRPQNFNDLYGQDSIKEILKDSIINNKLAHAYCFNGPRGTGKTSTAKLFAKAINCENAKDGIACGECNSCKNFNENPDIIEIDAASNNGVEEIRELRDNVKILPSNSKYKIYIIDEVHMLSQSAWNAFLKTLEEPPKHVIFILATTEIQKVPITVLSRCQRFTFRKIPKNIICERILSIAKEENIDIDESAAEYIADLADGGMRDALGYLDQLSKENKKITTEIIQNCFGIISDSTIEEIFLTAKEENLENLQNIFNDISNQGLEVNLLISKILNYLYNEEIKILQNKVSVFNDLQMIKDLAFEISNCYLKKDALTLIKIVILSKIKTQNGVETIKNTDKIISREIISKEITNNVPPKMNPIIEIHNNKVQPKEITKPLKTVVINAHSDEEINRLKMIRINNVFITASKINKETFNTNWNELKKDIKYKNSDLYSKIEDAEVEIVSDDIAVLSLNTETAVYLFNSNLETIEEEYNIKFNKKYKIICLLKQECTNAKKEYIKNKSKKYTYMEENLAESSVKENTTEENNNSALEIFGKDLIEIK
mgnify:FL=1